MKVALYARVSTNRQETENQLVQLREFAARQGWQIVREYVDHESGSRADRVQFQAMFADASKRRFDLLLFWALDRLTREGTLPTLRYLETLTGYGIQWRSFTEQFFDSCGPFRDAVVSIMATLAKQERVKRAERTKAGLAIARAKGKVLGRPRVAVDAARIATLRAQGWSWDRIAAELGIGVGTVYRAARNGIR